jgi:3-dehydroquinate synthase
MITNYQIQDTYFTTTIEPETTKEFSVQSSPRPYVVKIVSEDNFSWIRKEIDTQKTPLVLIDRYVKNEVLKTVDFENIPCYEVDATENNKGIDTVLKVCEFLQDNNANRGSMLYVIGGGIIQDLGAFAGAMYKRGIPWTFVPTTLLSQADSCLGGKTAVNHGKTKNVLGLFSAPRQVLIDPRFIDTLSYNDQLSGGGEIFRLLITGGVRAFEFFQQNVEEFISGSKEARRQLMISSLSVKKSIVERDEFEIDIRRSMNYGHSIGHAIEALSKYAIPHGQGVAIGILVENRIAKNRGMLSEKEYKEIYIAGKKVITDNVWNEFCRLDAFRLLPFLTNDKKAEGNNLKLATILSIGNMKFIDLPLNETGMKEVSCAMKEVIEGV